jgi:ceroid-lipofuscinosis MFS transporter 7
MLTLAQTLGFIFGPFLQGIFTPLGNEGYQMVFGLPFSMYTAPGWLNVLLALCNLFFFLPRHFQDKRVAAREQMIIHGNENEKAAWKSIKPDYLVAWTLIFSLFVFVFNFVLLEGKQLRVVIFNFIYINFRFGNCSHNGSVCMDEERSDAVHCIHYVYQWSYCVRMLFIG